MNPKLNDLATLIANAGFDPNDVGHEEILQVICTDARNRAAWAMAAARLGKTLTLVTREEARAALADHYWVVEGDEALSGKVFRAGKSAIIGALRERGLYPAAFADVRDTANRYLDKGETTYPSMRWPTKKRPSGRPGLREDFAIWIAILIQFMIGSGEASSKERAITLLTGRDRDGRIVVPGPPRLALPNSHRSRSLVNELLRWAEDNEPEMLESAQYQGEIAKAGGALDENFQAKLGQIRAILADPTAVRSRLRAAKQ